MNPEMMVIHVTEKINNLSEINVGGDKLSVAVPQAAPRYNANHENPALEQPGYSNIPPFPLRHSSSLESQVRFIHFYFFLFLKSFASYRLTM